MTRPIFMAALIFAAFLLPKRFTLGSSSDDEQTCSADGSECDAALYKDKEGNKRFRDYYFQPMKVPKLSAKDRLVNQLISAQQPVVIKDTKIVASAMNWSLDYLRDNIGNGKFMVCLSEENRFLYYDEKKMAHVKGYEPPHKRIYVTFREFYQMLKTWEPGDPYLYLQEGLKDGISNDMLKDFVKFNWDWANDQKKRNNWKDLTTNLLLIAQEGALTPAHYDEQENFLAQISGTKRIIFFSPSQFVNMYPYPYYHPSDRQSMVDFEKPDFTRFPRAAHVEAYEAIVKPGEVVYIPPFWWHHIETATGEGPSVSLTFWYKSAPYSSIQYPLQPDQKVTMMRNVEKMITEALNGDEQEILSFFRDLALGRYAQFPIDE